MNASAGALRAAGSAPWERKSTPCGKPHAVLSAKSCTGAGVKWATEMSGLSGRDTAAPAVGPDIVTDS